jgi:hypothetical protein
MAHAGRARRVAHALGNPLQIGERKALLDDEARREIERPRPGHGDVVDRAVHGERADIAAGEEQRRDDIAVGRHHHASGGNVEGRLVIAGGEPFIVEGGVKNLADQPRHGASAGAMRKLHAAIAEVELAACRLMLVHDAFRASF